MEHTEISCHAQKTVVSNFNAIGSNRSFKYDMKKFPKISHI